MIKARKAAGLTQRELADRLHKPQSFVAKYEGGERRIDVVEFLTVCQAIGANSAKLLKALKNAIANGNQRVSRQVDGIATRIG
jgi:transcriptional regulator with XRE-family HTH domain